MKTLKSLLTIPKGFILPVCLIFIIGVIITNIIYYNAPSTYFSDYPNFPNTLKGKVSLYSYYFFNPLSFELLENGRGFDTVKFIVRIYAAFLTLIGIGGILFYTTKNTRLLKFCFSIVFISSILFLLNILSTNGSLDKLLLVLAAKVLYVLLSFSIVNALSERKENHTLMNYLSTSKYIRLLHLIIDGVLILILVFIFEDFFRNVFNFIFIIKINLFYYFISMFCLYYIITEWVFQASPAKLLTDTKVITINNEKIEFLKALQRTLYRLLFIELFFYLINSPLWHDKITGTRVVEASPISDKQEDITRHLVE